MKTQKWTIMFVQGYGWLLHVNVVSCGILGWSFRGLLLDGSI